MRRIGLLAICIFCVNFAIAGERETPSDSVPFYEMSLEQLMNVSITVVSELPENARKSSGIVTVVTREEIIKSGARDLMQVLQLVPGFDFGVDVEGVVGIGVRGNWANEGKVLMLWDGVEMNEDLYSTLQFGGHYPVSQIKRIEIIRGPGSAIYGGYAEYAVINVITINNDLDGISVDAHYSSFSSAPSYRGISAAYGKKWENTHLALSTYQSKLIRSDRDYIDNFGNAYSMKNLSAMNSEQYRIDYSYRKFSLIAFCDNYKVLQRDGYDEVYSQAYRSSFLNSSLLAKVEYNIGKFKLTPGVKIKFEHPWYYNSEYSGDNFEPYDVTSNKNQVYLNYMVDPNKQVNLSGGFQYTGLRAKNRLPNTTFTDGNKVFDSYNYGGHFQAMTKSKIINFTLGSRFSYNKYYGTSFVPRLGVTKTWNKFHVKALYAIGYRAPSVENINLNWSIKPEYTYVKELEGGMQLGNRSYLTTNIYDITTKDPIIYYYNTSLSLDLYKNEGYAGTRGIEVDYKWKSSAWYAMINYAFYTTAGHQTVDEYDPKNGKNVNLAFPAHKFNVSGSWNTGALTIAPSATFYSKRYSISGTSVEVVKTHAAVIYGNINFSLEDFFANGLTAQFGIFNLLDKDVLFIQPYNGNHAPLPGSGREFQVRLNYNLQGNK